MSTITSRNADETMSRLAWEKDKKWIIENKTTEDSNVTHKDATVKDDTGKDVEYNIYELES